MPDTSNPSQRPWLITVIVIVLISWGPGATIVGAYADVLGLLALATVGGCAADQCTRRQFRLKGLNMPLTCLKFREATGNQGY